VPAVQKGLVAVADSLLLREKETETVLYEVRKS
jgi:hypothetical protein